MTSKKILYIGPNIKGSTTDKRISALMELKYKLNIIDTCQFYQLRTSMLNAIQIRIGKGPIYKNILSSALYEINKFKPKYLIIENGYLFNKNSLVKIKKNYPELKIIYLTVDSIKTKTYQKSFFLQTLCLYDYVITTKNNDIDIYKEYQTQKIIFSYQGIDEMNLGDYNLSTEEQFLKSEVVFIGDYRKERARSLKFLIKNNIPLKIFGFNWNKDNFFRSLNIKPVMDDKYYKALNNSKIALCFLNQQVGDTYTTRSFEIPASGTLLLAEETEDHKNLFKENKEAIFFSNDNDLLKKINYYLINHKERKEIAKCGKDRIKKYNFTWKSNLEKIFIEIASHTKKV